MRRLVLLLLLAGCPPRRASLYDGASGPLRVNLAALASGDGASARADGDGLVITLAGRAGSVQAAPEPLGLPRDASRFGRLEAVVENGAVPTTVELSAAAARGRLVDTRALGAHHSAALSIPLDELPLAADASAPYALAAVRLAAAGAPGATLWVRDVVLHPAPAQRPPPIDRFGQREAGQWPGKARSVEDLRAAAAAEGRALEALQPPPDRDAYGGWTKGPSWQEGGYFSVERDGDGRHWLVDPDGRAFWSLGAAAVRTLEDATPTHGREALFAELPAPGSRDAQEVVLQTGAGPGVAFYRWNVLRKWEGIAPWRERTLERFTRWGLNTIGAQSVDADMQLQRRVPHTRTVTTFTAGAVARTPTGFPDVFDPRWPAEVDRLVAGEVAAARENRWLLGVFADDEPRWGEMRLLEGGPSFRKRWAELLRERHGSVADLARAWGKPVASWDEAAALDERALPPGRAREDLAGFEGLWAETYFSAVAAAVRQHAPNHLYLGCRFLRKPPGNEEIVRAAGRHVDVLAINDGAGPVDRAVYDRWHALSGKPLLIAAVGSPLAGPRQPIGQPGARSAAERRAHAVAVLTALARLPYVVGAHWTRWSDAPLAGRAGDGDSRLVGLVDVTDRPHDDLVAALREVSPRMYDLHSTAR